MLRLTLILCLILSLSAGNAQVTEYNFLGKKWYVAGIDVKVKSNRYSTAFYEAVLHMEKHPDNKYESYLQSINNLGLHDERVRPLKGLDIGVVMRPFNYNPISFIRQIEVCHTFEYESLNAAMLIRDIPGLPPVVFKSYSLAYRPSLTLNSPTIWDHFKIYSNFNAGAYLPIRSWLFCNTPWADNKVTYTIQDRNYNDRIGMTPFKYIYGAGVGIKVYMSCKWNFHIDVSTNLVKLKTRDNSFSTHQLKELYFGFRYKLGVSEEKEEDESSSKPSVFW